MSLLTVNGLTAAFGSEILFADISFEVQAGAKIGLAGANGAGKTTLFRIITGEADCVAAGSVVKSAKCVISGMTQHLRMESGRSVYDEALSIFSRLTQAENELESLHEAVEHNPSKENVARQLALIERFEADGGLTYKARVSSALTGLGFSLREQQKPVSALSGGERSKLQLAKLLLSEANLLLLDEPTNHLDINALEWLESFLVEYKGAYIVITHDRYFLDKTINQTLELANNKLYSYTGNYTEFLRKKEEAYQAAKKLYDLQAKEIKRIEGIIEQQKRFNQERNYITIASKQKQIDRIAAQMVKPEPPPRSLRFHFPVKSDSGNDVLIAEDLSLSFEARRLFRQVNIDIKRGERVFLLGANGSGKTSLFRMLTGEYKDDNGMVRFGARVSVGYYDQLQSGLTESKTVMDEIWDTFPKMQPGEVRTALGWFLFRGDDVFKPVSALSGGEKARAALLKLLLAGDNLLLLDEPTNHLDANGREALELALADYPGTLFMISHDRYFINRLATRIYELNPDGLEEYKGDYDYYQSQKPLREGRKQEAESEAIADKADDKINEPGDYHKQKREQSEQRKLAGKIARAEAKVAACEAKAAKLKEQIADPAIATDYERLAELTEEWLKAEQATEQAIGEWAELAGVK
jgi:ATP-binding cassette subfamily F protein 3